MRSTKASRPAANSANGPLADDLLGSNRRVANKSQAPKQDLSSMQAAFLGALVDLAQRGDASIAPTGAVDPIELRQAVVALCVKGERGAQ